MGRAQIVSKIFPTSEAFSFSSLLCRRVHVDRGGWRPRPPVGLLANCFHFTLHRFPLQLRQPECGIAGNE